MFYLRYICALCYLLLLGGKCHCVWKMAWSLLWSAAAHWGLGCDLWLRTTGSVQACTAAVLTFCMWWVGSGFSKLDASVMCISWGSFRLFCMCIFCWSSDVGCTTLQETDKHLCAQPSIWSAGSSFSAIQFFSPHISFYSFVNVSLSSCLISLENQTWWLLGKPSWETHILPIHCLTCCALEDPSGQ